MQAVGVSYPKNRIGQYKEGIIEIARCRKMFSQNEEVFFRSSAGTYIVVQDADTP
jgi:hypothetical protein